MAMHRITDHSCSAECSLRSWFSIYSDFIQAFACFLGHQLKGINLNVQDDVIQSFDFGPFDTGGPSNRPGIIWLEWASFAQTLKTNEIR
jgi:hypothetical protein